MSNNQIVKDSLTDLESIQENMQDFIGDFKKNRLGVKVAVMAHHKHIECNEMVVPLSVVEGTLDAFVETFESELNEIDGAIREVKATLSDYKEVVE